jgi:AcrR family transcriptional regulator
VQRVPVETDAAPTRERARPLPPEDRRAELIRCVIPLLKQHGRDVSTKQIAEACGVAEGTIFRAFGDKESLITAAIESYFDPLPLRTAIRSVDPALPAEQKVQAVLELLRERFQGVIGLMSALKTAEGPPPIARSASETWLEAFEELMRPHREELRAPAATVGYYLRLVAFATAIPPINAPHEFAPDELLPLVTHGVLTDREDR